MRTIRQILIDRDGMEPEDADDLIAEARQDLQDRLANGEYPEDICEEWFGLEPDYLFELIDLF